MGWDGQREKRALGSRGMPPRSLLACRAGRAEQSKPAASPLILNLPSYFPSSCLHLTSCLRLLSLPTRHQPTTVECSEMTWFCSQGIRPSRRYADMPFFCTRLIKCRSSRLAKTPTWTIIIPATGQPNAYTHTDGPAHPSWSRF